MYPRYCLHQSRYSNIKAALTLMCKCLMLYYVYNTGFAVHELLVDIVACFSHIRTCEICEIATLLISVQPATFSARGGTDN